MKMKKRVLLIVLFLLLSPHPTFAAWEDIDYWWSSQDGEFILDAFVTDYNETQIRYELDLFFGEPERWLFYFVVCESYKVPETLSELDQMDLDGDITYIAYIMIDEDNEEEGSVTFEDKGVFWIYVSTGFNNYVTHEWKLWAEGYVEDEPPQPWEIAVGLTIGLVLLGSTITYFVRKRKSTEKKTTLDRQWEEIQEEREDKKNL